MRGRHTRFIAFVLFVELCLLPGEAFGLNWLNHANSMPKPPKWIDPPAMPYVANAAPHNSLLFIEDMGIANIDPDEPTSASLSVRPGWYEAISGYGAASGPVPQPGGLLIVAVAASWLVTCMTRNRRRTVHYRRNWTMPPPVRPSLREEAELGLLGPRRDLRVDTRVGAKN